MIALFYIIMLFALWHIIRNKKLAKRPLLLILGLGIGVFLTIDSDI